MVSLVDTNVQQNVVGVEEEVNENTFIKVQNFTKQWAQIPNVNAVSMKDLMEEELKSDKDLKPQEKVQSNPFGMAKPVDTRFDKFEQNEHPISSNKDYAFYNSNVNNNRPPQFNRGNFARNDAMFQSNVNGRTSFKVYVGGLPENVNCANLLSLFHDFSIFEIKVIARHVAFNAPFAYVEFKDEDNFSRALQMDGVEFMDCVLKIAVPSSLERAMDRRENTGYSSHPSPYPQGNNMNAGPTSNSSIKKINVTPIAAVLQQNESDASDDGSKFRQSRKSPFGAAKPSNVDRYHAIQYSSIVNTQDEQSSPNSGATRVSAENLEHDSCFKADHQEAQTDADVPEASIDGKTAMAPDSVSSRSSSNVNSSERTNAFEVLNESPA